jgi:release factor glutamine methyltransferase
VPGSIVFALDISLEALTVVKKNAEFNNVKVNCIQADILNQNHEGLDLKHMKFDIIVSNPPYVRYSEKKDMKANVLENEPHLALFVKDDNPLEYYNAITTFAKRCLNKNGLLFFEINQYLGHETCEVLSTQNFKTIELKKDINGNHRMIKAQLI